eukprot:202386-Pyramimonas_sp.AAC.1
MLFLGLRSSPSMPREAASENNFAPRILAKPLGGEEEDEKSRSRTAKREARMVTHPRKNPTTLHTIDLAALKPNGGTSCGDPKSSECHPQVLILRVTSGFRESWGHHRSTYPRSTTQIPTPRGEVLGLLGHHWAWSPPEPHVRHGLLKPP